MLIERELPRASKLVFPAAESNGLTRTPFAHIRERVGEE